MQSDLNFCVTFKNKCWNICDGPIPFQNTPLSSEIRDLIVHVNTQSALQIYSVDFNRVRVGHGITWVARVEYIKKSGKKKTYCITTRPIDIISDPTLHGHFINFCLKNPKYDSMIHVHFYPLLE